MSGVLALMSAGFAVNTPGAPSGGALIVTITPSPRAGYGTGAPYNAGSCTAAVSGGSGAYTYAWTVVSDIDGTLVIGSPSTATTSFTFSAISGVYGTAIARCTVTDTNTGLTGFTDVDVLYELVLDGGGSGNPSR